MAWDSPLAALADLVAACVDVPDDLPGDVNTPDRPDGVAIRVSELIVETPLEMSVVAGDDGVVALVAAPPRQAAETTVMPVLHRIRLRVEVT